MIITKNMLLKQRNFMRRLKGSGQMLYRLLKVRDGLGENSKEFLFTTNL